MTDWLHAAEEGVVGSLLLQEDRSLLAQVRQVLPNASGFTGPGGTVYNAILAVADRGEPIARANLLKELDGRNLTNWIADAVDVALPGVAVAYAEEVAKAHKRRDVIAEANRLAQLASDHKSDLQALVAQHVQRLVGTARVEKGPEKLSRTMHRVLEKVERDSKAHLETTGITTGSKGLDKLTDGFQKGDLIILAGRTSEGKTSFALDVTANAAEQAPVHFVSCEMAAEQLAARLLQREVGKNLRALRDAIEFERWAAKVAVASGVVGSLPIAIDARSRTVSEIRFEAQCLQARAGLGMIVVDYLQLLKPEKREGTRDREIGEITGALKRVGLDLNVPVLLLSQLNRSAGREKRAPELHDLRDSGCIEQDANSVLMLHLPNGKPSSGPTAVDLHVRKNREGGLGTIYLSFESWTGRWTETQGETS